MYGLKNRVQLLGNMGAAAEIRKTAGDKKVATFNLATNEVRKNENGERTTETQWHRLVAWGKLADIIEEYTTKGTELMVEGKLIYRSYVSKEGETKYITEIEVREIMMMGSAQKTA